MGGSFVALGLFLSSLTRSQVVAGAATFAIALLLWIVSWFGESGSETIRALDVVPVGDRALRGLLEGRHRHEAPGLLPVVHRVRAVPDRAVGGQRALEGLSHAEADNRHPRMARRRAGARGSARVGRSSPSWWTCGAASPSPVSSSCSMYIGGQWRDDRARRSAGGRRVTARCRLASILIVLGILARLNYIATRQSKRWDLTAAKQFSLSDQTRKVHREPQATAATSRCSRATTGSASSAIASASSRTRRSRCR